MCCKTATRLEYCDWNSHGDILEVAVTAVNNEGLRRSIAFRVFMIVDLSVKLLQQMYMLN